MNPDKSGSTKQSLRVTDFLYHYALHRVSAFFVEMCALLLKLFSKARSSVEKFIVEEFYMRVSDFVA